MSNGKAIYKPSGKAREYAEWACNLFVGCSNDCSYCYCKRGALGSVMGRPQATLKQCFRSRQDALETFIRELRRNADDIRREGGLFFSFSTDPCLPETLELTVLCTMIATGMDIPCSILTKCTEWLSDEAARLSLLAVKDMVAVGFTLTGHDEMEPGAATNEQRIEAMRQLHADGFRTFASIEPVVSPTDSLEMFRRAGDACDLFKVGLMSGIRKDYYDRSEVEAMYGAMLESGRRVFFKKSLTDYLGVPYAKSINIFSI